jgi:gentisate 1,2-dioxygenase
MSPRRNRDRQPGELSWLDVLGIVLIAVFVVLSFARVFNDDVGRMARQTMDETRRHKGGLSVLQSDQAQAAQPQAPLGAYPH